MLRIYPDRCLNYFFITSTPIRVYRYILRFLPATIAAFVFFFVLLYYNVDTHPVLNSFSGNLSGTLASFYILPFRVCRHREPPKMRYYICNMNRGKAIIMTVKGRMVVLLHHYFILNPLTSRPSSRWVVRCMGNTNNGKCIFKNCLSRIDKLIAFTSYIKERLPGMQYQLFAIKKNP